ncbi:MAG: ATP-binding cassette domain-containing protein [Microthrixaceae bacterium]
MSLVAKGMRVEFGGVVAVEDVSLTIESGEAVAIVGPNGSGKTTLLNSICGLVPAKGDVTVDGETVAHARPVKVSRAGIARTFQTPQVLDHLSCLDNVLLSAADRRSSGLVSAWVARPAMLKAEHRRWAEGTECLRRFGLEDLAVEPASRLTYGQRRWLELARVAVAKPRYLLADEPSAGLNDAETHELADHLESLRSDGIGIALVDHKVEFLRQVTTRGVVLGLGKLIAEAPIDDLWDLQSVKEAYLGSRRVHS